MTIDEFRADLESEVKNDALSFGYKTAATFAEKIMTMMREADIIERKELRTEKRRAANLTARHSQKYFMPVFFHSRLV